MAVLAVGAACGAKFAERMAVLAPGVAACGAKLAECIAAVLAPGRMAAAFAAAGVNRPAPAAATAEEGTPRAPTTPAPVKAPGRDVAAIGGAPWFTDASIA